MLPLVLILLGVAAAVVAFPLMWLWSLNVLFGLTIAYSFKTWLAALLLGSVLGSSHFRGPERRQHARA